MEGDKTHVEIEAGDEDEAEKEECPVCYEPFEGRTKVTWACGHTFCHCVIKWIKDERQMASCPLCRGDLVLKPKDDVNEAEGVKDSTEICVLRAELREQKRLTREAKKSRTGRRGRRDPNAPKRAKTAYLFFVLENRSAIQQKHSGWGFGEITMEVAKQWKKLSALEQKKYVDAAAEDRKRYEKEMIAYDVQSISKGFRE